MSQQDTRWDRDFRAIISGYTRLSVQIYGFNDLPEKEPFVEMCAEMADAMDVERKKREKTTGNANDLHELSKLLDQQDDYIEQLEKYNRKMSQRINELEDENDKLTDDLNRYLRKELHRMHFDSLADTENG